jgi:hypothetical protein
MGVDNGADAESLNEAGGIAPGPAFRFCATEHVGIRLPGMPHSTADTVGRPQLP